MAEGPLQESIAVACARFFPLGQAANRYKNAALRMRSMLMAQRKALIPTRRRERDSNPRRFRVAVFKTAALGRSAIPP